MDPLELDLYFERFINRRSSPPDFDIDWNERDDVTNTSLSATEATYSPRNLIPSREIHHPRTRQGLWAYKADIDTIVDEPLADAKHRTFIKHIFRYGKLMEGFPNYLSIHAGAS
jgi:DNA polymerase-3 subunit alpha